MNKIILTLEEEDILVLQEILLDNDNKAAMEFLKKCVAPKIPAKGTKDCEFDISAKHSEEMVDALFLTMQSVLVEIFRIPYGAFTFLITDEAGSNPFAAALT